MPPGLRPVFFLTGAPTNRSFNRITIQTMSAGLNPAQNEAVRYLDGPCLVLAGAGSGKTRVITQKIAHLIEAKGFEPRHIAAVTFTNKAALEMRERVGKLLEGKTLTTPGKEGRKVPVNQLTVCTFHSLGVQILRQEAEHVGLKPQFSIMDSDDCFGMIQDLNRWIAFAQILHRHYMPA